MGFGPAIWILTRITEKLTIFTYFARIFNIEGILSV